MAAVELGVFTKLARGADTEAALVAAVGLEPPTGERIVIACIGLGLIERDGEKLKPAPDAPPLLVEGEPAHDGPRALFPKPPPAPWGALRRAARRERGSQPSSTPGPAPPPP